MIREGIKEGVDKGGSILKQEQFRQPPCMLKRHPKPVLEVMVPPKIIPDFGGKKFVKARDAQLSKIQGTRMHAANPLTNLWSELSFLRIPIEGWREGGRNGLE